MRAAPCLPEMKWNELLNLVFIIVRGSRVFSNPVTNVIHPITKIILNI